jgi:hypothetical protein
MLRPEPHRGDVIAAGAVTLAALVALLQARFDAVWGNGVHLLYTAGALELVGTLALRAPQEGPSPRAYQSALFVVSFVVAGLALARVAEIQGADGVRSGASVAWIAALLGARPAPGCLGAAVLAATTLVVAANRATLLGWPLALALGAGALLVSGLRPSRPLPPAPDRGEPAHVFQMRDER